MRRLALAPVLAVALAACGDPEHKSPYDPATPRDQQARATLTGTVSVEPLGGTPSLGGVAVQVLGMPSVTTDATGRWQLDGVPPGTYTVRATNGPQYEEAVLTGVVVTLDQGGTSVSVPELSLRVARGSLHGTVILEDNLMGGNAGVAVMLGGVPGAAMTDAGGAFAFTGVPVGTYTVTLAKAPDWQGATISGVQVDRNQDATLPGSPVTLPAVAGASIAGKALLELQSNAAGTTVTLTGVDFRGIAVPPGTTAGTDADGNWSFGGLVAGSYQVTFSHAPGWEPPAPLAFMLLTRQASTVGAVTLPASRTTVTGTVTLSAATVFGSFSLGSDQSGTVVTLEGATVPVPAAVTDSTGAYQFTGVPVPAVGQFRVTGRRPGFATTSSGWATPNPSATTLIGAFALSVNTGGLTGFAKRFDRVGGATGFNTDLTQAHANLTISITGTAFNGSAYSAQASTGFPSATGAWTRTGIPPGSYDVVVTDGTPPVRACDAYLLATVPEGLTTTAIAAPAASPPAPAPGTVACRDTVAPGAAVLGTVAAPPGGQPGYVTGTSATLPVSAGASDHTSPASNFQGYQWTLGATPTWATTTVVAAADGVPFSLAIAGLTPNAANVVWVRGVDWLGNVGPEASAVIVSDATPPGTPVISTPRTYVNDTTTSVTLSGGADANFDHYEICKLDQAPATPCAACSCTTPGDCTCSSGGTTCAFTPTDPTFALPIGATAGREKACLWARSVDRAGNWSPALASTAIVSDLTPPPAPRIAPQFDPALFTVRADYVDFFVTGIDADLPAGATAWDKIAWVEIDTGSGFAPLCPQAACHANDAYAPCNCACTDPLLLCRGTTFVGFRLPLQGGIANAASIRAVDVAGNVGPGVGQQVSTSGLQGVVAASGSVDEAHPRLRGNYLTYLDGSYWRIVDLGANARFDPTDFSTTLGWRGPYEPDVGAEVASTGLVAYSTAGATQLELRRPGPDGRLLTTDDARFSVRDTSTTPSLYVQAVSASGERVLWNEHLYATSPYANLFVLEPGVDGTLAYGADLGPTLLTSTTYVFDAQLAGSALVWRGQLCNPSCPWPGSTYLVTASTNFRGRPASLLSTSAASVALSSNGTELALADAQAGGSIAVRQAGADNLFLTADDRTATRAFADTIGFGAVAVDGPHLVAIEAGSGGRILHWYAGGNGVFESSGGDDVVAWMLPSSTARLSPTLGSGLAQGYLVYQIGRAGQLREQPDLLSLDLTTFRWEVAAATDVRWLHTDGAGTLFYDVGYQVFARNSSGRTSGPASTTHFNSYAYGVTGNDLVTATGAGLYDLGPGPDGIWFTPDDVASMIHSGTFGPIDVNEGNAAAWRWESGNYQAYVYEGAPGTPAPGTGPLFAATPLQLDPAGAPTTTTFYLNLAVSGRHVFWTCGASWRVCFRSAGPDGVFGTGDDLTGTLVKPSNTAPPGLPGDFYVTSLGLRAAGNRVVIFDNNNPGVRVLDAGPDGRFNTSDDREYTLPTPVFDSEAFDLAGDFAAWSAAGTLPGMQITVWDLARGNQKQVTSHYSAKSNVRVDPTGRVYWLDQVLPAQSVFIYAP